MRLPPIPNEVSWELFDFGVKRSRLWQNGSISRKDTFNEDGSISTVIIDQKSGTYAELCHTEKHATIMQFPKGGMPEPVDPDAELDWTEEKRSYEDGKEYVHYVFHLPGTDEILKRDVVEVATGCRVRYEGYGPNGKMMGLVEIQNIVIGPSDPSVFEIPADYRIVQLRRPSC